jgi:hypothetical protein
VPPKGVCLARSRPLTPPEGCVRKPVVDDWGSGHRPGRSPHSSLVGGAASRLAHKALDLDAFPPSTLEPDRSIVTRRSRKSSVLLSVPDLQGSYEYRYRDSSAGRSGRALHHDEAGIAAPRAVAEQQERKHEHAKRVGEPQLPTGPQAPEQHVVEAVAGRGNV